MFAEISTFQRLWSRKGSLLRMRSSEILGTGSEDGVEASAIMDAASGLIDGVEAGQVSNKLMGTMATAAAKAYGSKLGPLGPLASQILGAFVTQAGTMATDLSSATGAADKTNQAGAAARDGVVQAVDLGKDVKNQIVASMSTGIGNSLQTTIAEATGIKLPSSIVTPIVNQVTQVVANKV